MREGPEKPKKGIKVPKLEAISYRYGDALSVDFEPCEGGYEVRTYRGNDLIFMIMPGKRNRNTPNQADARRFLIKALNEEAK